MYDKLFQEHKVVAFYSLAIALLLLVGIFSNNYSRTLFSQAESNNTVTRDCYYRTDCPPRTAGSQTIFRCQSTLICPTPSIFKIPNSPTPAAVRDTLSCNACMASQFTNLCFDTNLKSSYCANISPNLPALPPGLSCVQCMNTTSTPISRFPTRVITFPSRTRTPTPDLIIDPGI